jgi:GMP synthase (glutamine-hydrolysing)
MCRLALKTSTQQRNDSVCAVAGRGGMTAEWFRMPFEVLERVSTEICSEVRGINRVVCDSTSPRNRGVVISKFCD